MIHQYSGIGIISVQMTVYLFYKLQVLLITIHVYKSCFIADKILMACSILFSSIVI